MGRFFTVLVILILARQSWAQSSASPNPQQLFTEGEGALKSGDLTHAERAFQSVLAIDPQQVGAYANLGVVYMREKQWRKALSMLRKAETLAPQVAGIRL